MPSHDAAASIELSLSIFILCYMFLILLEPLNTFLQEVFLAASGDDVDGFFLWFDMSVFSFIKSDV